MTKRTDVHSPANIRPEDYEYEREILTRIPSDILGEVGLMGADFVRALREDIDRGKAWADEHGIEGNFKRGRTCDHCGTPFVYGSAFRHHPTGKVVVVGWVCAQETLECPDRLALDQKRARERMKSLRGSIQRKRETIEKQDLARAEYPDLDALLAVDHDITRSIRDDFEAWGGMTKKQVDLLRKLKHDVENPKPPIDWQPIEEGRRKGVEGIVLSTRFDRDPYGPGGIWKMLVHLDGDQKVWGSMPAALRYAYSDAIDAKRAEVGDLGRWIRGKRIRFNARFERSRDDACFGFFKRPAAAEVLEEPQSVAA